MADHGDLHHESAEDEYLPSPGASYESTDAHTAPIARYMLWLAVITVAAHLGVGAMFATMVGNRVETGERRYPMAGVTSGAPPEPAGVRLQTDAQADMAGFKRDEDARLNYYRGVDEEDGTVRLPIAEAMRLTVERGLPTRDVGGAAPSVRPSDASAGRTGERRTQ